MRTIKLVLIALAASACGGGDDGSPPDAAGGAPPVIESVTWTHAAPCVAGTASDVTITVTASDPDTPAAMLTVSGNVTSCGMFTGSPGTVTCPQLMPYPGAITVRDPEGNTANLPFTCDVCTDGMAP